MRTLFKTSGETTYFVIEDLDPKFHQVARDLFYFEFENGFAKSFPTDTDNLERIFGHFQECAEEMILQYAGVHTVPWESTLKTFLTIIEGANIDWRLAGSAALAVRGIGVQPKDIDLVVASDDCLKLGDLLAQYLIEPVQSVTGWIADWFGRSFIHARLEWAGGIHDTSTPLETVRWEGYEILVPTLESLLLESENRGLYERVANIREYLGR